MSKQTIFSYYFRINLQTIQGRITAPFLLMVLLFASILYFSNYYHAQIYAQKDHIQQKITPIQGECEKLLAMVRQSQYSFSYYLYYSQDQDSTSYANKLIWRNDIDPQRDKLRSLLNGVQNEEAKLEFETLNRQVGEIDEIQEGIEREQKTRQNPRQVRHRVVSELNHAMLDFERTLKNIHNIITKQIHIKQKLVESQQTWFYTVLITLFVAALLITYILGMQMIASIFVWIREVRNNIEQISKGQLPKDFKVRNNELKKVSVYSNTLLSNLVSLRQYAIEIGKGNFSLETKLFEDNSPLGDSLNDMGQSLQNVYAEERRRNWITEGLTDFSEIFRSNSNDLDMLFRETMSRLVAYIDIAQGVIFLLNREGKEHVFELKATYANGKEKFLNKLIPVYDGLLGRVYQEKEVVLLRDVPHGYSEIISGIGSAKPKNLLVIPLLDDEKEIQGALEIATLTELEPHKIDFLQKLAYSLASTIAIASISLRNQNALAELKTITESLKQKENETEAMMVEMNQEYQQLEIKAAENQRYADRLQAIFKQLPEPLILTNENGLIELFNPTAEKVWGYKAKDIMGKDYRMLLASDTPFEFLAEDINTNEAIKPEKKIQIVKKDGAKETLGLHHQETMIENTLFHIWLFGSLYE